ncbi:metalloregulator ArsR/SmtB family transcription factor [Teredinibacter sp. KSP-S5-2]|uniref:ArsR/SmtB family transcription factor n=1 Tax=Teredinibacter sp. KSP-S5-2 TaxID=3034506 RepID=UPI002934FD31|nr:metalloregulator ArsR/SmtB family transcription factor [Teredinibacter sp. KSP-S5-2]WNO08917.1 metalloregulator ArsR/SmtB family transcription factor [Teredinibacter sp. KSP-S5-2]
MSEDLIKKQPTPLGTELAQLLKAAGDPLRLEILRALSSDSFGVLELCYAFGVKQSALSHHLKVLSTVGLVTTRREGNTIFYRRNHIFPGEHFAEVKSAIYRNTDQLDLGDTVLEKIQTIHEDRAKASKQFFNDRAQDFKEQQDLIASFEIYGEQVGELLDSSPLPSNNSVLEIGPGAGEFLPFLAQRFDSVTALDLSASMLEKAKTLSAEKQLNNIQFICSDTSYCQEYSELFDCVVINMVLHHTPSPNQIFSDISQIIKPKGILLICDLSNHDQEWVKNACGDLWLGFDRKDLIQWGRENQFHEGQSAYFTLRNGFQIQIQQFIKNHPGDY